jgi:hypothetical protein
MTRRAISIAPVVPVLILLIVALNSARMGGWQLTGPRVLDAHDPIIYFIADGSGRTGYRSGDRELARWALEAWQRSAAKGLRFAPAPESSALIRLYWAEPSEGNYGEMRPLMVGDRRGAAVYIRPDMESLGPDIAHLAGEDALLRDSIVYLTCLHEFGHALGLEHTSDFADIMYYFGYGGDVAEYFARYRKQLHSRNDIASVSGLSDGDVKRIRMLYNRE